MKKIEFTPPPQAAECAVCKASLEIVDGEHVCGLTASEAYSLGWRRGNNAVQQDNKKEKNNE